MQSKLRALFAGKREAAEAPAKRGPGRPPKVRERPADERPDAVLEALQSSMPDQLEAYDERLRLRHRKRKFESLLDEEVRSHTDALLKAEGAPLSELRMPGSRARDSTREGPQVRLRLCKWIQKRLEGLGGTDEAWNLLVNAAAEQWGFSRGDILRILKHEDRWKEQRDAR